MLSSDLLDFLDGMLLNIFFSVEMALDHLIFGAKSYKTTFFYILHHVNVESPPLKLVLIDLPVKFVLTQAFSSLFWFDGPKNPLLLFLAILLLLPSCANNLAIHVMGMYDPSSIREIVKNARKTGQF